MSRTEGITFWAFPPAMNITFRDQYANNTRYDNISESGASYPSDGVLLSAVHNLTLPQRINPGFKNSGWGNSTAVVTVGDVIEFDWMGTENRTVMLDCMACEHGAKGGSIENACQNYTKSAHTAPRDGDIQDYTFAPGHSYTFPSLAFYFPIGDEACAICMFILYSITGIPTTDYSVPFSVLQKPAIPHKRFNADHPAGIVDKSIPTAATTTIASLQNPASADSDKPNVGMILGVVLGVMGGCMMLAILSWFLWRRWWKAKKKVVDSSSSSVVDRAGGNNRSAQDIALQRIQGVVRRQDSVRSEAPPPYHEAVRSGRPQQVR